jgi:hypothetical protein
VTLRGGAGRGRSLLISDSPCLVVHIDCHCLSVNGTDAMLSWNDGTWRRLLKVRLTLAPPWPASLRRIAHLHATSARGQLMKMAGNAASDSYGSVKRTIHVSSSPFGRI